MKTTKAWRIAAFVSMAGLLLAQGCSRVTEPLGCSASATVSSGNTTQASSTVVLSSVSVSMINGTGPFTIVLPNGTSVTSATSFYSHPSNLSVTTGSSGGITSSVSVTDTESDATATCTLFANAITNGGTTATITVTASPSTSAAIGATVTLTASDTSRTGATFTFALSTPQTGVVLSTISGTQATVTSTVAATVTVSVSEYEAGGTTVIGSTSTTLYFGSSSGPSTGSVQVTASPSTSTTVGSAITLFAYDTSALTGTTYAFALASFVSGVTLSNTSATTATVTSSIATTVIVNVSQFYNGTLRSSVQVTLSFGSGGSGASSLSCWLLDYCQRYGCSGSAYYSSQRIPFYIETSTGERVRLTQLSTGEAWAGTPPTFPVSISYLPPYSGFTITFGASGYKTVQAQAESESRPGVYCNGGASFQTSVQIY